MEYPLFLIAKRMKLLSLKRIKEGYLLCIFLNNDVNGLHWVHLTSYRNVQLTNETSHPLVCIYMQGMRK